MNNALNMVLEGLLAEGSAAVEQGKARVEAASRPSEGDDGRQTAIQQAHLLDDAEMELNMAREFDRGIRRAVRDIQEHVLHQAVQVEEPKPRMGRLQTSTVPPTRSDRFA